MRHWQGVVLIMGSLLHGAPGQAADPGERILEYELIEKSPQMLGFNVTYDYDIPPGKVIGLGVDVLVNGEHKGLVGHQKVVMPSGKHTVQTRASYIDTAPMRIETTEVEFSLYFSGESPFYSRRFPLKHRWHQPDAPETPAVAIQGTFTVGAPVPDFTYETSDGRTHSFRKQVQGKTTLLYAMALGQGGFHDWVLPMLEEWRQPLADKGIQLLGIQTTIMGSENMTLPKWKPFGPVIPDPTGEFQLAFSAMAGVITPDGILRYKGGFTPLFAQQQFGVKRKPTPVRPRRYPTDPVEALKKIHQPDWWSQVTLPVDGRPISMDHYGAQYRAPGVPNVHGRMILADAFRQLQKTPRNWITWVMPLRTMQFIDFNASDPLPYPTLGELGEIYLENALGDNHAGVQEIVEATARILIQEERYADARYWLDRYLDLYPSLTEKEVWVLQMYYVQTLLGQRGLPLARMNGVDYPFGTRVEGQHRTCVIKPSRRMKKFVP